MMTMGSPKTTPYSTMLPSKPPRRRVHICESSNTEQRFVKDLSAAEHASMWYSRDEFHRMKLERCTKVRQRQDLELCDDQDDCLRGLEKLMPSAKAANRQKRATLQSIVEMSHQLNSKYHTVHHKEAHSNKEDDGQEKDELLRQFCRSKTRYSQHKAHYMAAQDAAAVIGDSSTDQSCSCTLLPVKSITDSTARDKTRRNSDKGNIRFSSVNPRLAHRRSPMAAQTA